MLTVSSQSTGNEHHVKEGAAYPAVLLEIGMNDPRTDPWYSAKLAARLPSAIKSKSVLLRVEYGGGHFGDPDYNAGLEEAAERSASISGY